MGLMDGFDESEEQDRFVRTIGGIAKADHLQRIWNRSYPHSTSNIFRPITKEQDFRSNAKREGFTDKQIDAFLRLR